MQSALISRKRLRRRQAGTAYVLVLAITSMLVILGLAANQIARGQIEDGELHEDQVTAQLAAEYAHDVLLKQIEGSTTWRDAIHSSSWRIFRNIKDPIFLLYAYEDEIDGDVTNDYTQPVRISTLAVVGNARRVYSAEYIPDDTGKLVRNPDSWRQQTFN
ncbi:MAG: hypothetical protein ACPGYV_12210 [Phycisphaeraceae bacterium]